jgi:hypothetical protein
MIGMSEVNAMPGRVPSPRGGEGQDEWVAQPEAVSLGAPSPCPLPLGERVWSLPSARKLGVAA